MAKIIRLTESDLTILVNKIINENRLLNESDSKVVSFKDGMPPDATQAGAKYSKNKSKFTQVNIRTGYGSTANLYKNLSNWTTSAQFGSSGLLKQNILGYAYKLTGSSNSLLGFRDWGTLKKDFVLVYIPPNRNYKTGFGLVDGDSSKFAGWNYVWTSEIAVV
jgi:hypothetical protein